MATLGCDTYSTNITLTQQQTKKQTTTAEKKRQVLFNTVWLVIRHDRCISRCKRKTKKWVLFWAKTIDFISCQNTANMTQFLFFIASSTDYSNLVVWGCWKHRKGKQPKEISVFNVQWESKGKSWWLCFYKDRHFFPSENCVYIFI